MTYPNLLPLQAVVQDYEWGGFEYIPRLKGTSNPEKHPQAELWMGTHDRGPALISVNGQAQSLKAWINSDPAGILGKAVAERFSGKLPFLFKILDVRKMLSIQAHPTKAAAEAGFQRENELGIPSDAPHRNYKDDNHKPEIMVALTDFWLLHGFMGEDEIAAALARIPEFTALQPIFSQRRTRGLYQYLMELPQAQVDQLLAPLADRLEKEIAAGKLNRGQPDYWAALAFRDYTRNGHYDRGIFSIFLFNLVELKAGEGIYQAANIPHAYLEGVNVELMANSDNVFRGGLTAKHVDVDELMQHLHFGSVSPEVLTGETRLEHELLYPAPVPDFELSRISLSARDQFLLKKQEGPAIYIVLAGTVKTEIGELGRGRIVFSPHGARVKISGLEDAVIFRAGVPM